MDEVSDCRLIEWVSEKEMPPVSFSSINTVQLLDYGSTLTCLRQRNFQQIRPLFSLFHLFSPQHITVSTLKVWWKIQECELMVNNTVENQNWRIYSKRWNKKIRWIQKIRCLSMVKLIKLIKYYLASMTTRFDLLRVCFCSIVHRFLVFL